MMAKWKFNSDNKIICSNCGYVLSDIKHIPEELNEYCPNCKQYMKNSYAKIESDVKSLVYNSLSDIMFRLFSNDNSELYTEADQEKIMRQAIEWFEVHFFDD